MVAGRRRMVAAFVANRGLDDDQCNSTGVLLIGSKSFLLVLTHAVVLIEVGSFQ